MDVRTAALALDELEKDREFARRLDLGGNSSDALIAYFTTRGLAATDASLLALAYFTGRCHATDHFDRIVDHVQKMPR